ncbi:AAA family ATPase [Hydrogenivirga sp.]
MRPLKLELEGFTVYKKPQRIDFERLNFFIIQGKTGAGKTSIVDAITYALYGKVPRYGRSRSTTSMVLSKGSNRLRVVLEFSVAGKRYKIERFYREKPREDIVRAYEEGRRLDLKKSEVEKWVEEITGLDYNTFTKVILLPQGEFDRFLKPSEPKERRKILINLLNLEVFEKVKERATNTCRALEGELNALRAELESVAELSEADIEELEKQREELEREAEELRKDIDELEGRLRRAEEREELIRRLREIEQELSEFARSEDEHARLKERLGLAKKVLPFLPYVDRLEALSRELRDLRLERERVLKDKIKVEDEIRNIDSEREKVEREFSEVPTLREELEKLGVERERLSLAKEELTRLEGYLRGIQKLREGLEDREKHLRECESRLSKGEEYIREVELSLERLDYDEEEYERLLKEVERKQNLLEHQRRLEEVREELRKLKEDRDGKEEEVEEIRRRLSEREAQLRQENVRLYAHYIREHLHEGDRCPVCGGEFRGVPGEASVSELEVMRREVDELQRALLKAEKELSSLEAKIESLSEEERSLSSRLKGWESILKIDIESKLRELEERKREKKELEDKLKRYNERYNQLLKEREEALRAVEKLKSEISSLERSIREKEGKLKDMFGRVPTAEELEETLSKVALRERDIRSKVEEIERRREEVKAYSEELTRRLVALDTKLREIENSIKVKEEEKRENSLKLTPLFEELGDLDRVRELALSQEEIQRIEGKIEKFERERGLLRKELEEVNKRLEALKDVEPLEEIRRELSGRKERYEGLLSKIGELKSLALQKRELLKRKGELSRKVSELSRELRLYSQISEDLRSNRLQEFAASLMLKRVVERASVYLYEFTNTYQLGLDDRGDLVVMDRVQGTERDVKSLSGGETFLASLSLALGVSDVLSADAHLESLFIDEGFGSLDEETRERVSDILELLKQRINRMVGIISHIPDLAERFHQRIVVKKQGDFSTVEIVY